MRCCVESHSSAAEKLPGLHAPTLAFGADDVVWGHCRSMLQMRSGTSCILAVSLSLRTAAGVLSGVLLYGPHAADHCLLAAGLQPGAKVGPIQ
jgi:hypothetical protein